MKSSREDKREHWLLFKSISGVLLASVAILLLLRHASPVEESNKYFGGGVSLLLARTPEDVKDFRRWAELNNPGNIFGYGSAGGFTRSVALVRPLTLPVVCPPRSEVVNAAFFKPAVPESLPLKMEQSTAAVKVVLQNGSVEKRPFVNAGIPVYDEKGKILTRLENIAETNAANALLLRVRKSAGGAEFCVIGSSGDKKFDRSVTGALEKMTNKDELFYGVLAVWPDPKESEKK